MGLDMYLEREVYIGNHWEHTEPKAIVQHPQIDQAKVESITERAGYWRKANAIHGWFVRNVQGGADECHRSRVEIEQLRALHDLCTRILRDATDENGIDRELAEKELPPTSGFFFGSRAIDDGYLEDLKETISILKPILDRSDDPGDYYYRASW